MNYKLLNKLVEYIEDNLTNKIEYKKLSKIVGLNEFIMQRVFTFVAGVSISEYIRRRRLSKAYEDIKNTNDKIIDIAIRYQYDSSISFTRAFKKEFTITPSELRKNNLNKFIGYSILKFEENDNNNTNFIYEIKNIKEKTIYCMEVNDEKHENLLYKIRKLYDLVRKKGLYKEFLKNGYYGVFYSKTIRYHYLLGSDIKVSNMKKLILKGGKYAVFKLNDKKQKEIVKLEKEIYSNWINSVNYELDCSRVGYEYYKDDYCYIYVPLK